MFYMKKYLTFLYIMSALYCTAQSKDEIGNKRDPK